MFTCRRTTKEVHMPYIIYYTSMLCKGCYRNSIILSYSCGRAEYTEICYVWCVYFFLKTEEKILRFQEYPVTYRQGLKWPSHCLSSSLRTLDVRWRRKKLLHVQSNCFAFFFFISLLASVVNVLLALRRKTILDMRWFRRTSLPPSPPPKGNPTIWWKSRDENEVRRNPQKGSWLPWSRKERMLRNLVFKFLVHCSLLFNGSSKYWRWHLHLYYTNANW